MTSSRPISHFSCTDRGTRELEEEEEEEDEEEAGEEEGEEGEEVVVEEARERNRELESSVQTLATVDAQGAADSARQRFEAAALYWLVVADRGRTTTTL